MTLSINISEAKPTRLFGSSVRESHENDRKRVVDSTAQIYVQAMIPPEENFAVVSVDGETVATITNSGEVQYNNKMASTILKTLPPQNGLKGPELALQRAVHIAEMLGGKIMKPHTALSQKAWEALPPVRWKVNAILMQADGFTVPQHLFGKTYATSQQTLETIKVLIANQSF